MGLLINSGRYGNNLERGTVTLSDEDSDSPAENLFDGDPGTVGAVVEDTAAVTITLDGDLALQTGGFEVAFTGSPSAPPGWEDASIGGSASLVRDTSIFHGGASSCRLEASGGGTAQLSRTFVCRANEYLTLRMWLRGDGTNPVMVTVQDLETGHWLAPILGDPPTDPDTVNEWDPESQTLFSVPDAVFTLSEARIKITSMVEWPYPLRRIRVRVFTTTSDGWVDDFEFYPHWQLLALIGHNVIPSGVVTGDTANIRVRRADSVSGTFSNVEFITPTPHTLWHMLSERQQYRVAQIRFEGVNVDPFWWGEVIWCQPHHFEKCAMTPVQTQHVDNRVQIPRPLGGFASIGLAETIRRVKTFVFQHPDTPETAETGYWQEWYGEFMQRAQGGDPVLVIPNEDRDEVIFGHLSAVVSDTDGAPGMAGYKKVEGCTLEELALPVEI